MEHNSNQRNEMITFGKYKGKTVLEVLGENPQYLIWADENIKEFTLNDAIFFKACEFIDRRKTDEAFVRFDPDEGDLLSFW